MLTVVTLKYILRHYRIKVKDAPTKKNDWIDLAKRYKLLDVHGQPTSEAIANANRRFWKKGELIKYILSKDIDVSASTLTKMNPDELVEFAVESSVIDNNYEKIGGVEDEEDDDEELDMPEIPLQFKMEDLEEMLKREKIRGRSKATKEQKLQLAKDNHLIPRNSVIAKTTRIDKSEHNKHKSTVNDRCVQMKLNAVIRHTDILAPIENAVKSMTQMAVEGSRLCLLHVLRTLEDGQPVIIKSTNYFRNALCLVSTCTLGQEVDHQGLQYVFDTLYEPSRPQGDNLSYPSRDGLNQLTTHLSQQMYTNARTMVSTHLYKRLCKYIRLNLVTFTLMPGNRFISKFESKDITKAVNRIVDFLIKYDSTTKPTYVLPDDSPFVVVKKKIELFVRSLVRKFPTLFPFKTIKKRWCEYMPLLYHIASAFEDHINTRQKAKLHSMYGIKLFSMLPIYDFVAKNVKIDTSALQEMVKSIGLDSTMDGIWQRNFRAQEALGGDPKTRTFCRMINTDGVSVSIHHETPKCLKVNENAEPKIETFEEADTKYVRETGILDKKVCELRIPDDIERIIYVDPGGNTMASGILEGDCKGNKKVVTCGTKEYRHMASMDKLASLRKGLLDRSDLEKFMSEMPTPKGSSACSMLEHLVYLFPKLFKLLSLFGSKKYLNAKFTAATRKKKAMEAMVDRIAPKGIKTLVVMGAADFPHAMRGNVASAYKKLIKLVEARENVTMAKVGECNTSQKCCRCLNPMKNATREVDVNGEVHKENIHAVKVCPHCRTTWNRDLNAPHNIRHIFYQLRAGNGRPEAFRPTRRSKKIPVEGGNPQPRLAHAIGL